MPDDSNGIYNVPIGTLVNSGDTVLPSQHNPWANDSASAISNRFSKDGRAPATGNWNMNGFKITNLGTPASSGDATTKSYVDGGFIQPFVDIASATTTDIGSVSSQNVRITGTTTITGLGTSPSGTFRRARFESSLTLTYNNTSLILPGGASIRTSSDDVAEFISEGSGNWRCVGYNRSSDSTMNYTNQPSTSGTAISFASIPPGASVIQIGIRALSTNGLSPVCIQLGTSSGYVTTGYTSVADAVQADPGVTTFTAGFAIEDASAASTIRTATVWLTKIMGNVWIMSSNGINNSPGLITGGGTIALSLTLDRVRVTTIGGTDTFDAGEVSLMVVR